MNPILNILGGGTGNGFVSIVIKAVSAWRRGDRAEDFMRDLSKTEPRLQGIDFDDLEGTADRLARKQGKDINALKGQVQTEIQKYM